MKKCLKVKLLILIFLTGIQYVSAQGTAVNGTVVSDQNEPLVGVTAVSYTHLTLPTTPEV